MSQQQVQGLLTFLKQSPTAFHAVQSICERLTGFEQLHEGDAWRLVPGGKYYVTRNRSSVIAFTLPACGFAPFQLIASHTDSPTFRIKENAELKGGSKYIRLDTERYGGMILNTWLDRPLSVAGRLVVRTENDVRSQLVCLDEDCAIIPNVAIHMNREINNGYKYNPASDMMPLWGSIGAQDTFMQRVAQAAGVQKEDILGSDLYLYSRMPGSVWGQDGEYVSAGHLDDLECAYASLEALLGARDGEHINVCCMFDNEEVGSGTKQGADSTFLSDVLRRIALSLGRSEQDYMAALPRSFMLSADNAHATHPNHPELSDPVNQVYMNEGVVVKFNANQKYTTDGVSAGVFHAICQHADVPVQHFANRSDMAGGSTLGNISGGHVSVNTLDIGLAQLAMHSSYETAGTQDLEHMINAMRAFYETEIDCPQDGEYSLRFGG